MATLLPRTNPILASASVYFATSHRTDAFDALPLPFRTIEIHVAKYPLACLLTLSRHLWPNSRAIFEITKKKVKTKSNMKKKTRIVGNVLPIRLLERFHASAIFNNHANGFQMYGASYLKSLWTTHAQIIPHVTPPAFQFQLLGIGI